MKLSVSLSAEDVSLLDDYAKATGLPSRSAVVQRAIRLLQRDGLDADYAAAWDDWVATGDQAVWETAASDGLGDATR